MSSSVGMIWPRIADRVAGALLTVPQGDPLRTSEVPGEVERNASRSSSSETRPVSRPVLRVRAITPVGRVTFGQFMAMSS
jgi:hypothetical protein